MQRQPIFQTGIIRGREEKIYIRQSGFSFLGCFQLEDKG